MIVAPNCVSKRGGRGLKLSIPNVVILTSEDLSPISHDVVVAVRIHGSWIMHALFLTGKADIVGKLGMYYFVDATVLISYITYKASLLA